MKFGKWMIQLAAVLALLLGTGCATFQGAAPETPPNFAPQPDHAVVYFYRRGSSDDTGAPVQLLTGTFRPNLSPVGLQSIGALRPNTYIKALFPEGYFGIGSRSGGQLKTHGPFHFQKGQVYFLEFSASLEAFFAMPNEEARDQLAHCRMAR